MSEKFYY